MSVQKSNSDIEKDLETLEAEAIKQLDAEGSAEGDEPKGEEPEDAGQKEIEGERETPESESTTDKETTKADADGGEEKPEGDITEKGAPDGEATPKKPEDKGDGSQPSEKAKSRQHILAEKLKAQTAENERLQTLLNAQAKKSKSSSDKSSKLPWDQDGDGEITPEEIEKNIDERAEAIVEQKLFVKEALQNFQTDLAELEKQPELNTESEEFDQELVDFISENYKVRLKQNPALRLGDYANKVLELRRKAAERATKAAESNTVNSLRKRAATQPITGGVQTNAEKSLSEQLSGAKSIEELDALAEKNLPVSAS